jgi:hypothetical protein
MKILKFIVFFFNKVKILYQYFNFKIKIFSLIIEIIIIKLEYLFFVNKYVNKFMFFYKYNKILTLFFEFIKMIINEIKQDYNNLKKNIKKFRLFHRNMSIILLLFYLFFFFAGIIPFIYYILFLYFSLKYSIKYIFLCINFYIYNFYEYKYNEESNLIIDIYNCIEINVNIIFININKYYIHIDKFLFRMERRKKIKQRIIDFRFEIWENYVDLVQKYIDKFDNFVLIRFPELWYDFEVYLSNLLIRSYIYKARFIKKIKRLKRKLRKTKRKLRKTKSKLIEKIRHIFDFYYIIKIKIRKKFYKISFLFYKIKIYKEDKIVFSFFNWKRKIINNLVSPYIKFKYLLINKYLIIIAKFWHHVINYLWFKFMIKDLWFWDYIKDLYLFIIDLHIRAVKKFLFPRYPLFVILYTLYNYSSIIKMWKIGILIRIKRRILKIISYLIYSPIIFLYKFLCNRLRSLYKNLFVNIIILLKVIFRLIIFSLQKITLFNYLIMRINCFISLKRSYILALIKANISCKKNLYYYYNINYRWFLIQFIFKLSFYYKYKIYLYYMFINIKLYIYNKYF